GSRVAPRIGEGTEVAPDAVPPAGLEVGGARRGWRTRSRSVVLAGGAGEGDRERADVVDEVTEGRLRAGGRGVELVVGDGRDQLTHAVGGGREVDHRPSDDTAHENPSAKARSMVRPSARSAPSRRLRSWYARAWSGWHCPVQWRRRKSRFSQMGARGR